MGSPSKTRSSFDSSDFDDTAGAEDALLNRPINLQVEKRRRTDRWLTLGLGVWAALGTVGMLGSESLKKNTISADSLSSYQQ